MALLFEDAAKAKDAIMASQQKEIKRLYDEWARDVAERARFYSHKTNASAAVSERYYKELYSQMKEQSSLIGKEIQGIITSNMYTIADSMVASNVRWLASFGFSEEGLNAAFSYIPNDVVQRLVTGQIYQGGWNLSQRIWSDSQQTQKDIYQVMARGLAEQKSIYEIAKDLEKYVQPSARLPWNLTMSDGRRIYKSKVDYNAQRLARTLAQHSYQQSFIATTQKNPFITEYVWHSNGSRVCDLCKARDGVTYKKNELPMDHPNGMCIMEPVVAKDMTDQLADWFNSPDGTYPEIDEFARNFGYTASSGTKKATSSNVKMTGIRSKKLKTSIQDAFDQVKADKRLITNVDDVLKETRYAEGAMSTGMVRRGEGAIVKGSTIWIEKSTQKYIDKDFIVHEIGHLVTKYGTKITHATAERVAEELAKELGYKSVKSMSMIVSEYAATRPAELFPEAFMEYYSGKELKGSKKKIVEAIMKKMYFK